MAPSTVSYWTQNDTWPPLRLALSDDDGLIETLPDADLILIRAKVRGAVTSFSGTALPIDPPDEEGYNLTYTFGATNLAVAGTYDLEAEVQWDNTTTPPKVETWGSDQDDLPTLVVRSELG